MTAQSGELVRAYYAAFNAKKWDDMLALLSDGVSHHVNEGALRGGKERFAEFLAHMDRCYDERLEDVVVMVNEDGSRAAAEFIVYGVYKETDGALPAAHGQAYQLPAGAFFTIEAGQINRVTTYYNLSDWIAQVSG